MLPNILHYTGWPHNKNDHISSTEAEKLWSSCTVGNGSCCGSYSEMIFALGECTLLGICRRYSVMEGKAEGPGLQCPD